MAARAVGIVMEVDTGAIFAMSTKPDYDPNDPRTIVDETIRQQVNALSGEERSKALQTAQQAQWRNKAISDLYEPGSVFKLITCAAALDTGAVTRNSRFVCAGKINVAGTNFRCANGHIHGSETLAQGLAVSCNPCFIQIGARLGKERFWVNRTFAITLPPLACAPQPVSTCPARSSAANTIPPTAWARWSWLPAPSGKAAR